jgi:hypothetical protein
MGQQGQGEDGAETFERQKWREEFELKKRELALKEREGSLFKSPLVVSAMAVFVGLFSNAVSDWITKDRRLAEETRQREAALLVKAFEHNDPAVVVSKLNLLQLTGMISQSNDPIKKLGADYAEIDSKIRSLPSETLRQYQAALIQKAVENDDLEKVLRKLKFLDEASLIPDYDRLRKVFPRSDAVPDAAPQPRPPRVMAGQNAPSPIPVPPGISGAPVPPMAAATTTSPSSTQTSPAADTCAPAPRLPSDKAATEGWIYLGVVTAAQDRWIASDSGTRSIEFEKSELNDGARFKADGPLPKALAQQCLRNLTPKFLRGEGGEGRRLQSTVKSTLPPGARLRIVRIDSTGRDEASSDRNPVLWAKVEVISVLN